MVIPSADYGLLGKLTTKRHYVKRAPVSTLSWEVCSHNWEKQNKTKQDNCSSISYVSSVWSGAECNEVSALRAGLSISDLAHNLLHDNG